jgi:ATP-dependent DNA helicase RecG
MEKGGRPDTLVMTATPIPRSLAMTLYGDLDLSIIDEIPPGRQPVRTFVKPEARRGEVYSSVRKQLAQGRQAFIVYPLVKKSEKVDLRAATEMAVRLQEEVFPEYRVGLIHGRLKPEEKEALMADFVAGQIQVLVSTTVIEVGIDVPNASVMVVEHADRFGLSQLHQLRGRIGRGPYESYCILMTDGPRSQDAFERLGVMSQTSDGFKIAEKDLEIRGPGDFVGTRQSGLPSFYFGNIVRDRKWLLLAENEAIEHLRKISEDSRDLERHLAALGEEWKARFGLYEVG